MKPWLARLLQRGLRWVGERLGPPPGAPQTPELPTAALPVPPADAPMAMSRSVVRKRAAVATGGRGAAVVSSRCAGRASGCTRARAAAFTLAMISEA